MPVPQLVSRSMHCAFYPEPVSQAVHGAFCTLARSPMLCTVRPAPYLVHHAARWALCGLRSIWVPRAVWWATRAPARFSTLCAVRPAPHRPCCMQRPRVVGLAQPVPRYGCGCTGDQPCSGPVVLIRTLSGKGQPRVTGEGACGQPLAVLTALW